MAELDERERRATVRLVNYWLALHRGQGVPAFVDFDPHRNPIPWDQCLLASCGGPEDVALEHVGNALVALDHETAMMPSQSHRSFLKELLAALPGALARGEPQRISGIRRLPGDRRLLHRSVLLPFRSLDAARHYVLGAATFKVEPALEQMRDAEEHVLVEPVNVPAGADATGSCDDAARHPIGHGEP